MATDRHEPWWFLDERSRPKRWEWIAACILIVPFVAVPIELYWPWWAELAAVVAYFVTLWLLIEIRVVASKRRGRQR